MMGPVVSTLRLSVQLGHYVHEVFSYDTKFRVHIEGPSSKYLEPLGKIWSLYIYIRGVCQESLKPLGRL